MKLNPYGRELYRVTITTSPQLTSWEASFDGGTTWTVGADDSRPAPEANTWEWLVAGHLCDNSDLGPGELAGVITRTMRPLIRGIDSPEVIVRSEETPEIRYKAA